MTILTVDPETTDPITMVGLQFGFLEEDGLVISNTAKKLVVASGNSGFTFNGEGFGGFDGLGWFTTGVIQKITAASAGNVDYTIQGLSLDVPLFRHLMESSDEAGTAAALFGGHDVVTAALGNDTLFGYTGDDLLIGGEGDDYINGGAGQDTLVGGRDKDRFAFSNTADSTALDPDFISHLRNNDKIDLKRIDADKTTDDDQEFVIVAVLSGEAGELVVAYNPVLDRTIAEGDVDGDGLADLVLEIAGDYSGFSRWIL